VAGTTISTSGTGNDNDNLTIQNNAVNTAYYAIYARASSTGSLDTLNITGNHIGDTITAKYITWRGIDIQYATSPNVSQNEIFNMLITTSGDNAAMVAAAGYHLLAVGQRGTLEDDVYSR
jgi:hypothetical protein